MKNKKEFIYNAIIITCFVIGAICLGISFFGRLGLGPVMFIALIFILLGNIMNLIKVVILKKDKKKKKKEEKTK